MATIGTDPEFFVRQADQIIPVCGLLGGTKNEPIPLAGLPEGFGAQEDNVMAELTVPPALSARSFAENVRVGKDAISLMLEEHDADLVGFSCEHEFSQAALDSHAGSSVFGCSPDYSAYDQGRMRPRLNPEIVGRYRFCGGHVHIGTTCAAPKFVLAMMADAALGLWAVGRDTQVVRRQYYGEAGVYRETPYGIEYRSMSNFWACDPDYTDEVGYYAMMLANFLDQGARATREVMLSMDWMRVRTLVTDGTDSRTAQRLHHEVVGMMS
jgi:hypothetical protein